MIHPISAVVTESSLYKFYNVVVTLGALMRQRLSTLGVDSASITDRQTDNEMVASRESFQSYSFMDSMLIKQYQQTATGSYNTQPH